MSKGKSRKTSIAVRDFAVPLQRHGSLGSTALAVLPLDVGSAIHQQIQARLAADASYKAEYPLQGLLCGESHDLSIRGRCDGFYAGDAPLLEEIKSSFALPALLQALKDEPDHPYILQAKTYAYLYYLRTGHGPGIRLRLVDARSLQETIFPISFDPEVFALWVKARQQQIEADLLRYAALIKTRKRLAKKLSFPFTQKRAQQEDLMARVRSSLQAGRHLLLQAPTGLGKTAAVLYPALSEALAEGSPVIYVAPKNSQFKAAIDLAAIFQKARIGLKVLVLTSKAKACRLDEVNCQASACAFARDYFDKMEEQALARRDPKAHLWDNRYFQKLADRHEVCPYELGMERIRDADLIICDYNYIFSARGNFLERYLDPILPMTKPVLVIDEAHNLYERVMENFSAEIRLSTLQAFLVQAAERKDDRLAAVVQRTLDLMTALRPRAQQAQVSMDAEVWDEQLQASLALLMARSGTDALPGPDDPLFQFFILCYDWQQLMPLSRDAFPILYKRENGDEILRIQCIDPASLIRPLYASFKGVIAFSATLKPFAFYQQMSGFDPDSSDVAEFASPFPREHKKIMIIPQVQTNYRERDRHYQRIAAIIARVVRLKPGPYLAFFPSYHFLRQVQGELPSEADWKILAQESALSGKQISSLHEAIDHAQETRLILAVQGGSLAEGIDFKGMGLRGVFIIGPAVPSASFERQLMQDYFERKYGKGRSFAYVYPSMTRSVQAAGRIVRDETEKGLIVLMDPRFLQADFAETMPRDWFEVSADELVPKQILAEVQAFWDQSQDTRQEPRNRPPSHVSSVT